MVPVVTADRRHLYAEQAHSLAELHARLAVETASIPVAMREIPKNRLEEFPPFTASSAMLAPIIGLMWEQTCAWIERNPASRGLGVGPFRKEDGPLIPADLNEVREQLRRCDSVSAMAAILTDFTATTLIYHLDAFEPSQSPLSPIKQAALTKAIAEAIPAVARAYHVAHGNSALVLGVLSIPAATLPRTFWGLLGMLPTLYECEVGSLLCADQLESSARSCVALCRELAASQVDVFRALEDELQDGGGRAFCPQDFCLEPGTLSIKIRPAVFERLSLRTIKVQSPRSGCPVLFAKDGTGVDVIAGFGDWALSLCRELLWPALFEKPDRLPFLL